MPEPDPNPPNLEDAFGQLLLGLIRRTQENLPAAGAGVAPGNANVPLPYPYEKGAPRFDGDEYKIGTFLASFENRARMAGIEEARWKKHIVDYVDRDTRNQWMQLEEFSGDAGWAEFKEQVLKAYPENGTIKEYSLEELKEKIDKWKGRSLRSLEDVNRYTREFNACQKSLQRQGIVHQAQELYLSAFPREDRERIERRLEWKHPDSHYRELSIDDIAETVRFIAKNARTETTGATIKYAYSPLGLDSREVSVSVQPQPTVKRESSEDRLISTVAQLIEEKLEQRLGSAAQAPRPQPQGGGYAPGRFGPPRAGMDPVTRVGHDRCLFCDETGHMMRQCLVRADYLTNGRISEDPLGRMVLPGGLNIPGSRDKCIKKRVDEYWEAQARSHYYDSVMLLDNYPEPVGSEIGDEDSLTPEERDYQAFLMMREQVHNYETTGRFRPNQGKRFDGIELETRRWGPQSRQNPNKVEKVPGILPAPAAVRSSPPPAATAILKTNEKAVEKVPEYPPPIPLDEVAKKHAELTKKAADKMEEAGVTFRNKAPASDDSVPERVFERMLEAPITATVRELLATSGDLRRLTQKYTTTKRTPVSEVNIIEHASDTDGDTEDVNDVFQMVAWEQTLQRTTSGDFAAHESLPLMVITAEIDGSPVETIIDTGSTICCMSERVWKKIGCPVYTEKSTNMRDANGNVAGTLGAIVDQPIVIGGLTFYVTIHVVPNAPFSFILGTPFCAIASIDISYRPSSEMVIKVTDPNTDKSVLIPGSAKPRRTVAFIRPVESGKDF